MYVYLILWYNDDNSNENNLAGPLSYTAAVSAVAVSAVDDAATAAAAACICSIRNNNNKYESSRNTTVTWIDIEYISDIRWGSIFYR